MNTRTLQAYSRFKGLNQSDIARLSGVSRQTVSLWFKKAQGKGDATTNVYSKNLSKLAKGLGLRIEDLLNPLPVIGNVSELREAQANLLWDLLYPNLEAFVVGVVRGQPAALARLVQVYGLFQSAKIAGNQVWKKFPLYKNKIHPGYRKTLEVLWEMEKNQT